MAINKQMGFADECYSKVNQQPEMSNGYFNVINRIFQKLPLAAIVERKVFCVHGGIGVTLKTLQELDSIRRPAEVNHDPKTNQEKIIHELLWSDPTNDANDGPNTIHDYFKNKQVWLWAYSDGPVRTKSHQQILQRQRNHGGGEKPRAHAGRLEPNWKRHHSILLHGLLRAEQ